MEKKQIMFAAVAVIAIAIAVFLLFFGKLIASEILKSYIIREENGASYCETQADCEYVGYVCGVIDAGIFVNKREAERMRQLIETQHGLSDAGSCEIARYPAPGINDMVCADHKGGAYFKTKRCIDKRQFI